MGCENPRHTQCYSWGRCRSQQLITWSQTLRPSTVAEGRGNSRGRHHDLEGSEPPWGLQVYLLMEGGMSSISSSLQWVTGPRPLLAVFKSWISNTDN